MNNGLGLLFFFPETLFPPHKGDRGVLEPSGFWNARRAILYCSLAADIICVPLSSGTPLGQWNGLRASGAPDGLLEQPSGPLEQSLRLYLERPQASGTEPLALPGTRLALRDYSNPPSSLPLLPLLPESEPKGKGASTITYKKSKSCS